MAVQFEDHIDMNGLAIREVAAGVNPTDAVNVSQLDSSAPQGFAADVGDGVLTTYNVVHNLGTLDVLVQVYDKNTGQNVNVVIDRIDANTVQIGFSLIPLLNSRRVVIVPVPVP